MLDEKVINLEQARQMIEGYSAVNLDEVSPEKVRVAFCEILPSGTTTVIKEINTRVPMFAFNNMLANQKRMQRLRRQQLIESEQTTSDEEKKKEPKEEFDLLAEDTIPDFATLTDQQFREILSQSEPAIIWQAREVLTIWKLTPGEGDMSLKRLMLGLTFEQIQGLFSRFFGAMIRQKQNKA